MYVYLFIYLYIYTHTHTHIYIYIYIYIHTYIHTYIHSSRVFRKAGMTFLFIKVHNVVLILGHDDKKLKLVGYWTRW